MGMVSQLNHTVAELQHQQQNFSKGYRLNQTQPNRTQSNYQHNQRVNYNPGRGYNIEILPICLPYNYKHNGTITVKLH